MKRITTTALPMFTSQQGKQGFTLIELLVVLAIIALLATVTLPRYFQKIDTAKESILLQNLLVTRETIDKFYGDTGRYPESLQELVDRKYLKTLPLDPVTGSTETWIIVPPEDSESGKIYDVRSGAPGKQHDGKLFSDL